MKRKTYGRVSIPVQPRGLSLGEYAVAILIGGIAGLTIATGLWNFWP